MKANRFAAAMIATLSGIAMAQTGASMAPCPTAADRTLAPAERPMDTRMQAPSMGWSGAGRGGEAGTTGVDMASRPMAPGAIARSLPPGSGADASTSTAMGANAMGSTPSTGSDTMASGSTGATNCQ